MKIRSRANVPIKVAVNLIVLSAFLAATVVPVLSAQDMSQELEMVILNRLSAAGDRETVLGSAAKAVEVGYPEESLSLVIEKSLDSGISPDALSGMIDVLEKAQRNGLPTQPFTEKIMEGLVKKVKEDRILTALGKVDNRIQFAAVQAAKLEGKKGSSQRLIIRTNDAIAAGMDRKNLERVFNIMAKDRVNRRIEPEEIMEMVKAASGYGVNSRSVGNYAISLMKDKNANIDDIREYLDKLSEKANRRRRRDRGDDRRGHHDDGDDDSDSEDHDDHNNEHDDSEGH